MDGMTDRSEEATGETMDLIAELLECAAPEYEPYDGYGPASWHCRGCGARAYEVRGVDPGREAIQHDAKCCWVRGAALRSSSPKPCCPVCLSDSMPVGPLCEKHDKEVEAHVAELISVSRSSSPAELLGEPEFWMVEILSRDGTVWIPDSKLYTTKPAMPEQGEDWRVVPLIRASRPIPQPQEEKRLLLGVDAVCPFCDEKHAGNCETQEEYEARTAGAPLSLPSPRGDGIGPDDGHD